MASISGHDLLHMKNCIPSTGLHDDRLMYKSNLFEPTIEVHLLY
eukprot:Gb_28498 [translate_table: standard]